MEKKMTELTKEQLLDAYDKSVDRVSAYQAGPQERIEWLDHRAELLRRLGAAVSASPQPRCPKCGSEKLVFRHIDGSANRTCAFVAVQCPTCLPEGTIYLDSPAEMAQFFAPAPAQEPPTVSDRMQGVDCPMRENDEPHKHIAPAQPVENSSMCKWCNEAIMPCPAFTQGDRCKGFIHLNQMHTCQDGKHMAEPISGGASTHENELRIQQKQLKRLP